MRTATLADLAGWMSELPTDAPRQLARAAEVIDDATAGSQWNLTAEQEAAIVQAICAQVEFWAEVGEESDIRGDDGSVSVGGVSLQKTQPKLAPRARRLLSSKGLLSVRVGMGSRGNTYDRFQT